MELSLKTFLLIFALICLAKSQNTTDDDQGFHCTHNQHQEQNPPEFLDVEEDFAVLEEGRVLGSRNHPNIRIYANYEHLADSSSSSYTAYVQRDLAPAVIEYFQNALKIKYPVSGKLKLSNGVNTLCGMRTPSIFKNSGVDADYAIIFDSRVENSNIVATSKYCYLSSGSKRPLIATTNFNQKMFKEAKGNVILHEKNTYLLFHEMMHTFGFSKSVYKYFVDGNGRTLSGHVRSVRIAGEKHTVVDVAPLTEKLRKFHGCSSIPGAIMENDGGSGTDDSHFEKKFYVYETMASGSLTGKRISELSLALLEGSGWYEVDYSYAEPYFYGQGQGCNFINGQCNSNKAKFDEFCTGNSRGCSSQGHSGGSCFGDDKTDGCRYVNPSDRYHCDNSNAAGNARLGNVEVYGRGAESKCFTGSLNTRSSTGTTSFCFTYNCVGSGSNTQLEVLLGRTTAVCRQEGKLSVNGYNGSINCPDPLTFCNTVGKRYCPRNCMGRGKCVNDKCHCESGFKGVDCALRA